MTFKCLTDVVGVTKKGICYTADTAKQALLLASTSGLYIDEIEGGITFDAVGDADTCNALADIVLDVKKQAIQRTQDDVRIQIAEKYTKAAKPYIGSIGETSFTAYLPASPFFGQKWRSNGHVDGVIIINKVSFAGNVGAAPLANNVTLYALTGNTQFGTSSGLQVVKTASLTAANQMNIFNSEEIRLPLTDDIFPITYYWVVNGTDLTPRNNRIRCNCGNKLLLLDTFLSTDGFTSATNIVTNFYNDSDAHGLVFDVEIRCDDSQLICREYDNNNSISITLAYAVQYKAAELLIESVLRSPNVSRFTMMNREYLWGKRNHFKKEYEDRIIYIKSSVEVSESTCFICRQTDMIFGNIVS